MGKTSSTIERRAAGVVKVNGMFLRGAFCVCKPRTKKKKDDLKKNEMKKINYLFIGDTGSTGFRRGQWTFDREFLLFL